MNTTGQHVLNYLIAAAAIVAGLSPNLMGSHGPAIVGAAVLAGNVLHGLVTADPSKPTGTVVKSLFTALVFACVLTTVLAVSACKTAPTATQSAGITVAVDIATGAAIQNGASPAGYQSRAANFKAIAVKVKAVNDAGTATLATLAADIAPLIATLPPADQLAAHALIAALTPYLNQEIAASPQLQNTQATLDTILQAVIDSCSAYGA